MSKYYHIVEGWFEKNGGIFEGVFYGAVSEFGKPFEYNFVAISENAEKISELACNSLISASELSWGEEDPDVSKCGLDISEEREAKEGIRRGQGGPEEKFDSAIEELLQEMTGTGAIGTAPMNTLMGPGSGSTNTSGLGMPVAHQGSRADGLTDGDRKQAKAKTKRSKKKKIKPKKNQLKSNLKGFSGSGKIAKIGQGKVSNSSTTAPGDVSGGYL